MEFSLGNVKITYYYDDGKQYEMSKKILDITGEKELIMIESIEITGGRLPYEKLVMMKNALNAFRQLNTENCIIAARVYVPEHERKGKPDVQVNTLYEVKSNIFDGLGFFNINQLYHYDCLDIRPFILPDNKGAQVIEYCSAIDYMIISDCSLLPLCKYHVDNLVKSGQVLREDRDTMATKLCDRLEEVIHEFNTRSNKEEK